MFLLLHVSGSVHRELSIQVRRGMAGVLLAVE